MFLINNDNIIVKTKDKKDNKIYINLKALDKITAKTSSMKIASRRIKNFLDHLEITAFKVSIFLKEKTLVETVAYLQVKDLSAKDNDQCFYYLMDGLLLQALHCNLLIIQFMILWITSCENI